MRRLARTVFGARHHVLIEYVPDPMELEDHVPVYIPEPEHPEDLVPAEDEAPTPPLPPFFLSPRIRRPQIPEHSHAEMRDVASSLHHSLHPSGTPPLLPIPLPAPSTSRRADIPEADTPPRKRLLLTTPRPGCEVGDSFSCCSLRDSQDPLVSSRQYHAQKDRAAVRAEIEVLRERETFLLSKRVCALQGQQGPAGGPAQPELPEEAGSSS
ncbi:hypothetical protein Tco_1491408 [Tanacetum coccineum]